MKKIAAIITEYKAGSHADVIIPKFLHGFPTDEGLLTPRTEIASIYIDQFPAEDIGRDVAGEFDIPIYPSIVGAHTRGGDGLDVILVVDRSRSAVTPSRSISAASTMIA